MLSPDKIRVVIIKMSLIIFCSTLAFIIGMGLVAMSLCYRDTCRAYTHWDYIFVVILSISGSIALVLHKEDQ